ncbi:hypothetical protein FO488_08690 [Geobacter sp. FeAm09]|uniref:hypothetical protein n=1 Tax=Geobacter sp. FeAm09 TaxID=2597769 RepID=UPI0011ECADBD|nr:hypothetical protein [Geobacter sp. FeAm09]QEM68231.1 hypothetical protein FO488_08690 [Geobacter sp. FeAm09]
MSGDLQFVDQRDKKLKRFRHMGVYGSVIQPHRSMTAFHLVPSSLLSMIAIPFILILFLLLGLPHVMHLWQVFFSYAFDLMGIESDINVYTIKILPYYYLNIPSCGMEAEWPTITDFSRVGITITVIFIISFIFSESFTPLIYFLRVVCLVQLTAFVYFKFEPVPFSYNLSEYN